MKKIALTATFLLLTACAGTTPHLSDTLNETDQERLESARYYAFAGTLSQQSVWSNVSTGNGGTVRALREFRDADGRPCRKIIEDTRSTQGARDIRIGTACQQLDGKLVVTFDPAAEE